MSGDREEIAVKSSCPKCGSHDVRRSKSDGAWALLQRALGRWPFRCRSCRVRFFQSADPPEERD